MPIDDLNVQRYLRDGGTLASLTEKYAIHVKRHGTYPELVLLKYSMTESPMGEPLVQECRGIILNETLGWSVTSYAFSKFFNHGEGHAAVIDWSTARVQEKVDGSLCVVYRYDDEWHVATSGTPDASGDINGSGSTFADYFWSTFPGGYDRFPWPHSDAGRYCFIFEITGPVNRIVVPHAYASLTLLGARDLETGLEVTPQRVAHFFANVEVVKEFPLTNMADVTATFSTMSPLSQEGYVIVDAAFNRVKVKHPGYVALHHAKDGMTTKAFVEIARTGETSEVIAAFPEFKPMLDDAKGRFDALLAALEADYARHKDIAVQKDFAMAVNITRCPAAMFAVRARKAASVREYLAKNMRIDVLMQLLGYKDAV